MQNYEFYQKKLFDDSKHSSQPYEKFEDFLFVFNIFSIEHLSDLSKFAHKCPDFRR